MTCAGFKEIFENQINRTIISRDRDFLEFSKKSTKFEILKEWFFRFFGKNSFWNREKSGKKQKNFSASGQLAERSPAVINPRMRLAKGFFLPFLPLEGVAQRCRPASGGVGSRFSRRCLDFRMMIWVFHWRWNMHVIKKFWKIKSIGPLFLEIVIFFKFSKKLTKFEILKKWIFWFFLQNSF